MTLSFAKWRNDVVGRYIDIDGWYGAQCWDLWADYAIRCHGAEKYSTWTSGDAGRDTGLASSVWLKFPAKPGIDRQFVKLGRDAAIQAGDVLVWARSILYPDSHIAVATGQTSKGYAECVSQNNAGSAASARGKTEVVWLPLGGLLGLLRPKSSPQPAPKPKELKVKHYAFQDRRSRALAPGEQTFLNPAGKKDQNVVGSVGPYSITPHVYAEGMEPGDVLEVSLNWQNTKDAPEPWKNSSEHYVERVTADRDGKIKASREFKRAVKNGDMVYVRVRADKGNQKPATVTLIDCDSYLFVTA